MVGRIESTRRNWIDQNPGLKLPRPKITAEPMLGCRLIVIAIVVREISVMMIQNAQYQGALGSSKLENIRIST